MPLIILTGIPGSGKTKRSEEIKEYFENQKNVIIISEYEIMKNKNLTKNVLYKESSKEKEIRGIMKSEFLRKINKDDIIILDGGNYIKGFRYEIYCGTKSAKTTQCTIHVETPVDKAWEFNKCRKDNEEEYSKEIFDELVLRYEPPCHNNRWDSPLFVVLPDSILPVDDIDKCLFDRKPPPPNLSTLSQPLLETNFLYEVEKTTQDIISVILSAKQMNMEGDVKVPGTCETFILKSDMNCTLPVLNRIKRQFLTYLKSQTSLQSKNISTLFVHFLNSNV